MPSILLIGDTQRREFREADAAMTRLGNVVRAADIDAAIGSLDKGTLAPDAIVLAQAYPGQFAAEAVERLRHRAPLARIVGLLGSWCEGEVRTGEPWPGVIRLYWHQWLPQAERELGSLLAGRHTAWALPATATDEERLLAGESDKPESGGGLVVLCVQRFEMHDWLAAACRRRGYSTVWLRPGEPIRIEGARAAIFDGGDGRPEAMAELRRLAASFGRTPIIALLSFPRIEDHDRATAAGATAVLSKPLLLDDLFQQLERPLRRP